MSQDKNTKLLIILSITFNFLAILTVAFIPVLFKLAINSYDADNTLVENNTFLIILSAYAILWLLSRVFIYLRERIIFPIMEKIIHILTLKLFAHIQYLPFQYHVKRKTGHITAAVEAINRSTPPIIQGLFFSIGPLIFESMLAFCVVFYVCGFTYALILGLPLLVFMFFTRSNLVRFFHLFRRAEVARVETSSKIFDSLINFSAVKYSCSYEHEIKKIDSALQSQEDSQIKAYVTAESTRFYQNFFISLFLVILILYTGYNVVYNDLSLGDFVMINSYIVYLMVPIENLGQVFQRLNQGLISMDKALTSLHYPIDLKKGTIKIDPQGQLHIKFEDVWFGYARELPILKGVSFEIFPGENVGIIGESGSGKSTLIGLLLRFLSPWSGSILINGHNIEKIDQKSLLDIVGVVPQDITLFNETIYNNVNYGYFSKNEKGIFDSLYTSGLDNTVEKLPEKFNTVVGERGVQLSGGEKQRVSIARALNRKPRLYIFDEGTSALDMRSEEDIIKRFNKASLSDTVIFITHRMSTLRFTNKVIVLKDGKIESPT